MKRTNIDSNWLSPPRALDLKSHLVDIWRVSMDIPDQTLRNLASTLSIEENERAARFHFSVDRDRFTVAHGCLRNILSRYLHCQPCQLEFCLGKYGKPALMRNLGMEFSLSHSGDYALIAVAQCHRVGVDLEYIRDDINILSLAAQYFSKAEVAELQALPLKQRESAFFALWTLKEAYIKAQGLGLSLLLDSFDVSLSINRPSLLCATRPDPHESMRWTLQILELDSSYKAAIAIENLSSVEEQNLQIRTWNWIID